MSVLKERNERREEPREESKERKPSSSSSPAWEPSKKAVKMRPHAEWWVKKWHYPLEFANQWLEYRDKVGWRYRDGTEIDWRNFQQSLRLFCELEPKVRADRLATAMRLAKLEAKPERREEKRRAKAEEEKRKRLAEVAKSAKSNPAIWEICALWCANVLPGGGCKAERPVPFDRECPDTSVRRCPCFVEKSNGGVA